MAKRKIVTRGEEPLVLYVKRRCMDENVGAWVATSSDDAPEGSCCSSNRPETRVEERVESVDLVHEIHVGSTEDVERVTSELDVEYRTEMTTSNGSSSSDVESVKTTPSPKSPPKSPLQVEIDQFFENTEKEQLKMYTKKYNFDFVKDAPLEGRYKWEAIKP